jgi:hypothetical protein
MFDVEAARAEQYAVQTNPDDPRHVQVERHLAAVMRTPYLGFRLQQADDAKHHGATCGNVKADPSVKSGSAMTYLLAA